MDTFLRHAQQIMDVAQTSGADATDFALIVRPDGGLHFLMEAPFSLEGAAEYCGAGSAFRVTRSVSGVRVEGRTSGRTCVLEEARGVRDILPDRALYRIIS